MNIDKYTSYFHDGGILDIKHYDNNIEIWMESNHLYPEWNKDQIPLSDFHTIKGKLHLKGIKNIITNNDLTKEFYMKYDDCEILKFYINENTVKLIVTWCNFPPKERISEFEIITINAEKIEWENLPNL